MPGRDERRRSSEDEQEQGRIKLVLPTPGEINQGAPASSLELDLPRVRGALGEGGSAGRSAHKEIAREDHPRDDDLGQVVP